MQTLSCISHMDQAILFAYKYDSMNLSWEMSQDAAVGAYCHICYVDATEDLVCDFMGEFLLSSGEARVVVLMSSGLYFPGRL